MRLAGWRIVGELPNLSKAVVIVVPHTSNWDFAIGVAGMYAVGVRFSFFAKDSLFGGILGPVMTWLGGIPIDRSSSKGVVDQVAARMRSADKMLLVISPEGTRSRVEQWKTGFYHIAVKADVPIVPVAFDWKERLIVFGEPMTPTGDMDADLDVLRRFFEGARGKRISGMARGTE
jgi:1-acyl-sn-glycerol-3-phosphate acyltransferase